MVVSVYLFILLFFLIKDAAVTVYDNACMCKNLLGKGAGVVC